MIVTIKSAKWEEVKNPIINKSESKRVVRFIEKNVKPWICNQGNAQTIVEATGVKFMEDSPGQKIQLYVGKHQDRVSKQMIDCIRVREVKPAKVLISESSGKFKGICEGLRTEKISLGDLQSLYDFSPEALHILREIEIGATV